MIKLSAWIIAVVLVIALFTAYDVPQNKPDYSLDSTMQSSLEIYRYYTIVRYHGGIVEIRSDEKLGLFCDGIDHTEENGHVCINAGTSYQLNEVLYMLRYGRR